MMQQADKQKNASKQQGTNAAVGVEEQMKIAAWEIYGAIGLVVFAYTMYLLRKLKQRAKSQEEERRSNEDGQKE